MRKYRNQIITGLAIVLIFYIGFFLLLDSQGQFAQAEGIRQQLLQFPLTFVGFLILAQIGVIFFRFIEWQYYLGVIDASDKISIKDSFIIFVASFTFVVTPAKAGELLKSVLLKLRTDVPVARSMPIIIAERVVDGIAVIVILAIVLLIGGDRIDLGIYDTVSRQIVFSSLLILAAGLIVVQIQPLAYFFLNIASRLPLINRLHQPLVDFYESSRQIFSLRHVLPMVLVGVGVYASSSAGFVLVLIGFGAELTPQLAFQAAFIVGVAAAVGALSFVPNGAGVTEITNVAMLTAIVAPLQPALTPPVIAAAAILQGFAHKWFRVLVGLVVILIYRKQLLVPELESELEQLEDSRSVQSPVPKTIA